MGFEPTQLGIDGCRRGNAAYLIVVIEVIGVFKASTLYVHKVARFQQSPCRCMKKAEVFDEHVHNGF
ncbi:hypothetical protein DPMN_077036 [Dreissena polymorpha]|uniref:Uncharacterized protein n=1 Tax=Dreissena polymorpha TaxID=45954 RepID=A0A9D3YL74_DREPO|nr:hypothetical protein DPMN_077036 [Dreissena polymorpha]